MRKCLLVVLIILLATGKIAAQNISGTVVDAQKVPIPGATVTVKGNASMGTITDADGKYMLNVPEAVNKTLVFSFIGYQTQEQAIGRHTTVNVVLQEATTQLNEVVAIGYGVQKKSVVTAAISSVNSKDLEKITPSRVEDVLKGQVSGVMTIQNSGQPGSDSNVRIRGAGTTGNNNPLYIVDGMEWNGGIRNLNPADIASVEVLKDAASAAVYGTRGGNGVILITTKSGGISKPKLSYNMSMGYANPWKKKELLNSEEYMIMQNQLAINSNSVLPFSPVDFANLKAGLIPNTDWQDVAFNKNAPVANHQVSVSGGTQQVQYYLSIGYFNEAGILGGNYGVSNYKRLTIRANNRYEIYNVENERNFLNKIKIGHDITYGRANSTNIGTNDVFGTALGSALAMPPIISPYLDDAAGQALLAAHPYAITNNGRVLTPSPGYMNEIRNPLAIYLRPSHTLNNEDKFAGSFWGEITILPKLIFKSSYGVDLAFWGADSYSFPHYETENLTFGVNDEMPTQTSASSEMHRGFTWQIENTLTYDLKLGDHSFTFLAGQSARKSMTRNLWGQGKDLKVYDPYMAVIDNAQADQTKGGKNASGGLSDYALASYFGRVSYNYAERYMAQATIRYDGSYIFGPQKKWGTFPSFSLGWNVWNEPYLQTIKPEWWEQLKLRGSWGINGSDRIDAFTYMALMESGLNYYFGGNTGNTLNYGISAGRLPNPTIHWEQSQQTDLGADMAFLHNGALTFSFDWYKKHTTGMLRQAASVPGYTGQLVPYVNTGIVNNTGWEFYLGYQGRIGKYVTWGVKANASQNKNTIVDYGNASGENGWGAVSQTGLNNFIYQKNGYPNPFFYGLVTNGIAQTQEEADTYNFTYNQSIKPGDLMFKDLSGPDGVPDGVISNADRKMIGDPTPDWVYGLTLNVGYRGFDLSMFFQGVAGNQIFDISRRTDLSSQNLPAWMLDSWTGPGTTNKYPRFVGGNANNSQASDFYIKDGSYTRLKNIQLGYTLPQSITRKATISQLRVWIGAENLLTFTKYDGFDPEIGDGYGVDKGIYPQPRTVSFGLDLTF